MAGEGNEFPAEGAGIAPGAGRGGGEGGPGTPEAPPRPGGRGKRGWTPSNARLSLNWAEARVFHRVLRVGENSVGGTRAARAGEEGGHSPFPRPRPHCLSRLRPGPTPQHVLAALIRMPWIFFFFLLLFFVCRVSERLPTWAPRSSARRFYYRSKSRELKDHTPHLCPPPGFPRALQRNGAWAWGEGFQLGFSISTTFKTHSPNPRFVLASHVFVGFGVCDFFSLHGATENTKSC